MKRPATTNWRRPGPFGSGAGMLIAWLGLVAVAVACNVPVFRYALERWQPDPYRVTLFHRGDLTEAQRAALKPLEMAMSSKSANLVLRLVNADQIENDADRALFDAQSPASLPWLVVQYPQGLRIDKPVQAGPLADDAVARLVDSPLRQELIRRLAGGQTAVWLMLECGQAEKDDAVAAQLASELEQLSQKLELPELTSAPEDTLLSSAPLEIKFSLLRVARSPAAEQALVDMLLGSEPDLAQFDAPMVFPVFGRGRALLPLIGDGITADNIHESAAFLVGACSCEVKELNPGFDLLLTAPWDELFLIAPPSAEVLAARASAASGKPELVAIPAGAAAATATSTAAEPLVARGLETNFAVNITVVGLVLVAAALFALKRFV